MSDETITSLQNPRVKLVHSLQNRPRARRIERKIALEGARLVGDALASGRKPIFALYEPAHADMHLIARLQNLKRVPLLPVSGEVMAHVSDTQQPQGIVAVFGLPAPALPDHPRRALILDAIREPGNMGTLLRTAAASGADIVILGPGCVDPYNPKVLRAGMGAHFRVPVIEATWGEITDYTEGMGIYLAAGEGDLIYSDVDWTQPWALVIGNEAHGVGEGSAALNDARRVSIPMAAATESLNAAVAAGVILFEAARQRRTAGR